MPSPRPLVAVVFLVAALAFTTSPAVAFDARGSTEEAYVVDARKGERLELLNAAGGVVARGRADSFGSKIFVEQRPGRGYRVRRANGRRSRAFTVLRAGQNPPAASYRRKRLKAGLNYVKVRDGVEIAMTVRLPPGRTLDDGPFPTVIEYSGYQTAAPNDLLGSIVAGLTGGNPVSDPLAPASSTVVGAAVAPLLGFATVSVQMRGSGCSGGAFDLFGLPTTYDGYDAVETVAAQRWVERGRPGMVGISFSGITQLFTAGTRPPHLAGITPMSVTDDMYEATANPGGIFNRGFALSWLRDRMEDAEPAPRGGQPWARALTRAGDKHCIANQRLRLQTRDLVAQARRTRYRTPSQFDDRSPIKWMRRITAPTFLVGQYHDEQTGGHFTRALGALPRSTKAWLSLQNGAHVDSLGPSTVTRWIEFLKLYVDDEVPRVPESVLSLSSSLYDFLAEAPAAPVEQSRFADFTDPDAARAVFERDPRVRLLMENGAGPAGPGSLGAAWELGFEDWPVPQARPLRLYLGDSGALSSGVSPTRGGVAYVSDPRARPRQTLPGSGEADAWKAQPPYSWEPVAPGKGVGWTGPVLRDDAVIAGTSSLDVWLESNRPDTDLQVTLSEVRPDGRETYVQNGWLRASLRALDLRRSTPIDPVPTYLESDARPLPRGRASLVRVPIYGVAHAFRAGSRIRVTVQAPGGDRPRWDFASIDSGRTRNTIALGGGENGSALVLPLVRGADAKGTPLPAPTALRGQPSRPYVPAANGG